MKRPLLALLTLAAALGLVAAGCGGVAEQADGTVPDSASLAPADAVAFATVTTDESSEQWQQAADLLDRLPGAKDDLVDEVTRELRDEGLTWKDDVAPALGPEVVVVVTADGKPIVFTKPDVGWRLDVLLAKSDTPLFNVSINGWEAIAEPQTDLDAYEAALARGTLAGDDGLEAGFAALPEQALVRAWVDVAALTPELGRQLDQAQDLDLGVDWLSAGLAAEDDGVRLAVGVRTPGGNGTEYEPTLVSKVPADAVAALSFGGTQKTVDEIERRFPLQDIAGKVEDLTGVSVGGVLDAFSGQGILYVRPGRRMPEVTLALEPPDPDAVWQTVDRIAHRLAASSGTAVRTTREDGREVSIVEVEGTTVRYARVDDQTVVVTTGAEGIRDFASDGDKLSGSDAYRRAADAVGLGDRTGGFLYVDVDGLVPLAEGLSGEKLSSDDMALVEKIDAFVLEASGSGDSQTLTGFLRLND
jgi:hypothetical protein